MLLGMVPLAVSHLLVAGFGRQERIRVELVRGGATPSRLEGYRTSH
jgi:hypothetical protein